MAVLVLGIDPSKTTGVALLEIVGDPADFADRAVTLLGSWLLHLTPAERTTMDERQQCRTLAEMLRHQPLSDGAPLPELATIESPQSGWNGRVHRTTWQLIARYESELEWCQIKTARATPAEAKAAFGLQSSADKGAMMAAADVIVRGYDSGAGTKYEREAIADACAIALAGAQAFEVRP